MNAVEQKHLEIYDTTLRDGAQGGVINFSVDDKIRIAKALDELGVDYIEGGWPGGNDTDTAFFKNLPVMHHAKIVAFGMTRRKNCAVRDDKSFLNVAESAASVVCLFGKTWDFHVHDALHTTLTENLAMISDSVAHVKSLGKEMIFDAEHFFDGYKNNPVYAMDCLRAAHRAGADRLVLCDTNGGTLPHELDEIVRAVALDLPEAKLGIHAHNDSECAVANTVAATRAGCVMTQGTCNGYGERSGNASLTTLLPVFMLKMGYTTGVSRDALEGLKSFSEWLDEVAEVNTPSNRPFVGEDSFRHKGGVHASAVLRNPQTYEHINPVLVGNQRHIPVSEQAGQSNLRFELKQMGFDLTEVEDKIPALLSTVKKKEEMGYTFSRGMESFKALAIRLLYPEFKPFHLPYHKIVIEGIHDGENGDHDTCAVNTVLMCQGERSEPEGKSGEGAIDALDKALRKELSNH